MTKVETVLQKYGVTLDDVIKWAAADPKVSKYIGNKRLIARQYVMAHKKVDISAELGLGMKALEEATAKISDLEVGKWNTVKGLVLSQQRETSYMGCPVCFKKLAENSECEKHGEDGIPLMWRTYIFGDDTGDIILSIPPALMNIKVLSKEVIVHGQLNDQLEFHAKQLQTIDIESATAAEPVAATAPAPVPETQTAPPATVLPETQASDVQKFKDVIKIFKIMDLPTLNQWAVGNGIKTPLQTLINSAGCKIQGSSVVMSE